MENIRTTDEIQSQTIDYLRFPLAIAVVFIHNFGTKEIDLQYLHSNPFSIESIFDFVRILFSNIGTHFAVPTFFMISGFLFFYKIKIWNLEIYKQKLKKRFKSLFIPYILWIALCILQTEIIKFLGVIIKGKPISGLWQYIIDNGGIHLFWNSEIWGLNYTNWLGYPTPLSGPTLIPLWFVRDLLVVIIFTPIIYYVIKKFNIIPIIVLGLCYISGIFIRLDGFSANCFFWFSLGAYFSINNKNMVNCIQKIKTPAYIIAICSLLPLIWLNGRKGDGITMNPISNVLYYIYVISAVFSAVSITAVLLRKNKIKVNTTITKTTFFIFLSHIFILMYVTTLLDKIK